MTGDEVQQLTQRLKDGKMRILEVPYPGVGRGEVLVRNHYSLISAGTEGKTVRDARMGYVAKARARQNEVKQVLDSVRINGLATTIDRVSNRLEAPSSLGYSCAGEVIAAGPDTDFRMGDRVACAGATAVHAEVVSVPKNLCVRVPDDVDLRAAAFSAVASIALQGIRQADLQVGSNCVVLGLGLVGLLSVQLLKAAGIRVAGLDVNPDAVRRAETMGALGVDPTNAEDAVLRFTRGAGTDAVIICAGTSSNEPVETAGVLCRQKGKVVVVGSVPTGFSRKNYYRKELDLRMSCSYGPGRYDPLYEDQGIDYPIGYVRWTENRNMQAYMDLLSDGRLDPEPLISHTFPIGDAQKAYDMIVEATEPFVGILLEYDRERPLARRVERTEPASFQADGEPSIGFIGAGSFAQNILLPFLKGKARLEGVVTHRPNNARHVSDTFGFRYCTGEAEDVLSDPSIGCVFVATRHDAHATYVTEALKRGKDVFVEKPLCLTRDELDEIREAYAASGNRLMVGFNRRFAPHVLAAKARLHGPVAINYRIHAGKLPPESWVNDPLVGGGRVLGEVCHFIDLVTFLAGAPIERVAATAMEDPHGLHDTLSISLGLANGSVASIAYFSVGSKEMGKERLEVSAGAATAVIDDFRRLKIYGPRPYSDRLRAQDKGHAAELDAFLAALREGRPSPIPFHEIDHTTTATFAAVDSLRTGQTVTVSHG